MDNDNQRRSCPDWRQSAEDAWRTDDRFRFHMLELTNLAVPSGLHYAAETWEELPEFLRAELARVAEEMGKRILADIRRTLTEGRRDGSIHSYPNSPVPFQELPEAEKHRISKENFLKRHPTITPEEYDQIPDWV